jgi:ATP synthase protein I
MTGFGLAMRIGTELVAAIAVGVGLGYVLDMWLGTKPWLMVVFFFLGSAAGMLNVYRATAYMGRRDGGDGA